MFTDDLEHLYLDILIAEKQSLTRLKFSIYQRKPYVVNKEHV